MAKDSSFCTGVAKALKGEEQARLKNYENVPLLL